ncbi:MAG: proteorhodopsin activator (PAS domain sensor protein) [Azospira oryzae]|jgi:PAS domain S-box-containing protein|nr:MAG: proteorhodopsin activator (PAS domain sensor protein) [Azospira oryzae]
MKDSTKKKRMHPLLSWDIIADRMTGQVPDKDLKALQELKKKYKWNVNITTLLKSAFDAIVITDVQENICWTSKGFEQMTGYKVSFARNKKPTFLQGAKTNQASKVKIREAINRRQPVSETVINYRKDGSEYTCRVAISPLYNSENTLTHFIALESEVN